MGTGDWYLARCVVDTRPPGLKACLIDRVPGYPDRFTLSACFDEQPSSCTFEAGTGIVTMVADGDKRMSAEVGMAELVDPSNITVSVSDDLGNTAEQVVAAHLSSSVSPSEKLITTQADFETGILEGTDAQSWPGFLTTDATSNPDWRQLGYSPYSFSFNAKTCTVGDVVYFFGHKESDGQGGYLYPVWAYDTLNDTWSTVAYAPKDLSLTGCAAIGGKIYLAGAYSPSQHVSQEVWCFDPVSSTFSTETALPRILIYHAAVSHGGYLYVFGGLTIGVDEETGSPALVNNTRVFRYDPASQVWEDFCSFPQCMQIDLTEFLSGSMYLNAISAGDYVYVFNAAQTAEQVVDASPRPIFRFDPAQASFEVLGESKMTGGLASDQAGRIYLLGECEKYPYAQNNGRVKIFSTTSGELSEGPSLPFDFGFALSAYTPTGIRLFGAGGSSSSVFASSFDSVAHFTSEIIDLGGVCQLGTLSWLATSGPGTEISCAIRTSGDGTTWSDWSEGSQENMDLAGLE